MKSSPSNIIISRTDSIGDVVLTLPMAAVLKQYFPGATIGFIGKSYTKPVINACKYVDEFIDREDFLKKKVTICGNKPDTILHVFPDAAIAVRARKLGIRLRIGTTNRIFHWGTCNKLVKLSRRNADLHEAQLNLKLLEPFGCNTDFSLAAIGQLFGLENLQPLPDKFTSLLDTGKYNLILHPKSQGSAREWGLNNFISLINLLDKDRYHIFISGTAKERSLLDPLFEQAGNRITDITGQMNLDEFVSFIAKSDGLVANSTGPLHIASALGKDAMGIYPPMRPIHPGRWAPLGPKAKVFVLDKFCIDCKKKPDSCHCMMEITPAAIKTALEKASAHNG
ncbi:MAG: glycosyltransferase family 9 protein [Bacteroidota bacterium]